MAQPITVTKSKDHRRRKNPRSADAYAQQRKDTNAKRVKQRPVYNAAGFVGWTREAA